MGNLRISCRAAPRPRLDTKNLEAERPTTRRTVDINAIRRRSEHPCGQARGLGIDNGGEQRRIATRGSVFPAGATTCGL
jgi:hypothetical protein